MNPHIVPTAICEKTKFATTISTLIFNFAHIPHVPNSPEFPYAFGTRSIRVSTAGRSSRKTVDPVSTMCVVQYSLHNNICVHRCAAGGSMRACHVAGPGSISGRDKFLE